MKMYRFIFRCSLMMVLLTATMQSSAQCAFRNTAFNGGEFLTYNLYYNWKFVWVKAGNATMYTVNSIYQGKQAFRASLTTRGNGRADKMFVMRDTLLCYTTTDLAPLYFRKGAKEGKRYTVDEVFYNYPGGKTFIKQHFQRTDGTHAWQQHTYNDCVYDMLSIFLRARSFNPVNWQKGHVVQFPIVDGDSRQNAMLKFRGKSTIKADNDRKYRCLELSYLEQKDGKLKEIVRFYVTDDENHIPIRLDMFLKFGSAKAFLVSMRGNKHPITAEIN